MTQTPLTKAIEHVESIPRTADGYINIKIDKLTNILKTLLPYEREVIEGAYSDGVNDEAFGRLLGSVADNSTDYFTKTFTNGND